jgi:outer membrane protein OmpA-like peptidoglycan-associated protein
MGAIARRSRGLRLRLMVIGICVISGAHIALAASAQAGQTSPPQNTVQTGPINEPRGAEEKPIGPPIVKGIQAIKQTDAKCSETLSVGADALFGPKRWTLNPDAGQTLDALGPLITKAGKHPVRIESFTDSAGSDSHNQMLSEKRAITVRGWLVNHGFVPEGTPIEGFGQHNPVAPNTKADGSDDPEGRQKNRHVDIVIDTCGPSK